eukprot:11228364-Lingulodinium_polyedra.AAC.2
MRTRRSSFHSSEYYLSDGAAVRPEAHLSQPEAEPPLAPTALLPPLPLLPECAIGGVSPDLRLPVCTVWCVCVRACVCARTCMCMPACVCGRVHLCTRACALSLCLRACVCES